MNEKISAIRNSLLSIISCLEEMNEEKLSEEICKRLRIINKKVYDIGDLLEEMEGLME